MAVVSIAQALSGSLPLDSEVTVRGWVRTRRDSKAGLSFIALSDGSCVASMQLVVAAALANYDSQVKKLSSGCAIMATGKLVRSHGRGQSFEIHVQQLDVVGWVDDPETYPIQPKAHSLEFLRDVAHLRPRTNLFAAITRIRHTLSQAVHRFFDDNGFFWISTPIITTSDAEGAGELFRVSTLDLANLPKTPSGQIDFSGDFFGKETFLTVSGQLNVEAYALAMSKVYTFGPTFRAEQSHTTRHLAEFWMIEPEIAFADLMQDAQIAEDFLKAMFRTVLNERHDDLVFLAERAGNPLVERLEMLANAAFVRLNYDEAVHHLQRAGKRFEFPVEWGLDLQTEHERWLTEEHVRSPVIVMNYPEQIKAFYMRLNDDGRTVAAMDVLAPGIGEIIGGSQREERLDYLDQRMQQFGLEPESYNWYRDFRRYGTVPHAGFGLGFERLVVYVCGLSNIRDAIAYPRAPGYAQF